jgi:hypothetical protein
MVSTIAGQYGFRYLYSLIIVGMDREDGGWVLELYADPGK